MPLFRLVLSSVPLALMLFAAPAAYACDCGEAAAQEPATDAKSACSCGESCSCDACKTDAAGCDCNQGAEGQGACDCDKGDCGCATGACGCGH
jgi:hypothetical protein